MAALAPLVDSVVVAVPAAYVGSARATLGSGSGHDAGTGGRVTVVAGGATRQESVRAALAAVDPLIEFILVHDAARPFVPVEVVARVIDALQTGAAAVVPVVPLTDSLRRVQSDGASTAVDRTPMRAVQTPQGFRRDLLLRAHREVHRVEAADDASLVERSGVPVTLVPGSELAFKITRPHDLVIAEAVLAARGGELAGPSGDG